MLNVLMRSNFHKEYWIEIDGYGICTGEYFRKMHSTWISMDDNTVNTSLIILTKLFSGENKVSR